MCCFFLIDGQCKVALRSMYSTFPLKLNNNNNDNNNFYSIIHENKYFHLHDVSG